MPTVTITQARNNLFELADMTLMNSQETLITTKKGNLIMIGEDDWRALQETLYLSSNPEYKQSLLAGLAEKSENLMSEEQLEW